MNTTAIDLSEYHMPFNAANKPSANSKPKLKIRKAMSGPFLKGPICMTWLTTAAKCGGKCLECALAIQHLRGLKKSDTIRLSRKVVEQFGVSRTSGYRALQDLEGAGLVKVHRAPGRLPLVTCLDLPADEQ